MKLHDILKGSDYSLELFTPASIEALENRINEKVDKKGKLYYSVNCIIREKEIKLTPEEIVRQLYTEQLIPDKEANATYGAAYKVMRILIDAI